MDLYIRVAAFFYQTLYFNLRVVAFFNTLRFFSATQGLILKNKCFDKKGCSVFYQTLKKILYFMFFYFNVYVCKDI